MPIKTSGLGRGLGSLIPNKKNLSLSGTPNNLSDSFFIESLETKEKIWDLPVDKILPNPNQPRRQFDDTSLKELAESIKEHGVIQPIIVAKQGDNWQLIAGERRLRASKIAGLKTIPAIIRGLTEQKKMEIALLENLQRENLNALEIAWAYRKLIDEFNLTHEQLAKKVGKSASVIHNHLRLLNLHPDVQEAILAGRLTEGHARTLGGLPLEDQLEGMKNILEKKMTVREAEASARAIVAAKKIRNSRVFDPELKDYEDRIATALGTRVEIRRRNGTGQITIKFFSNDELKDIVNKLIK